MSDLKALEDWVAPLIERLSERERRQLAATIARDLRRQQVANIRAQRNPDGSAWEPRKQPARNQRGQIRSQAQARKSGMDMFARLRTPAKLKAQGTPTAAVVGFVGMGLAHCARASLWARGQGQPGQADLPLPGAGVVGGDGWAGGAVREMLVRHLHQA